MNDHQKLEAWTTGVINKRLPDALTVLAYLLKAGLKRGQCSAQDIPEELEFDEPNVIGAIFKLLPRCGFIKDRTQYVKLTVGKKHGREVPLWRLAEHWKADFVLSKLRRALPMAEDIDKQMRLF